MITITITSIAIAIAIIIVIGIIWILSLLSLSFSHCLSGKLARYNRARYIRDIFERPLHAPRSHYTIVTIL